MTFLVDNLSDLNRRLEIESDEDGKRDFFCDTLVDLYPIDIFGREVGVVVCFISLTYIFASLFVIGFINRQAKKAQHANVEESRIAANVIFPVFVNILWINAAVMFYVGMISLLLPFGIYSFDGWYGYFFAGMYGIEHCVIEGVAFLLMTKGLGFESAKQCVKRMIIWFVLTMVCKTISFEYVDHDKILAYLSNFLWELMIAVFYLVLWKCPHKHLFRRPAAIFYSKFWFWFRISSIFCNFFHLMRYYNDMGQCFELFLNIWLFAILEPIVIYYTLLEDAYWWQGLLSSKNSDPEDDLNQSIKSPLAGIDVGLKSAQVLAASMDSMSSGDKLDLVRLLNFSYIALDTKSQLGTGSFSKVYRGSYKNQECAIKLIFTVDLTIDVIERIAAEAQILSSFKHPNIVSIIGVSVLPPSVCILLELCAFGSLADVVKGSNLFQENNVNTAGYVIGNYSLSIFDRLYLAIGCANGLKALHQFDSKLCHRDVKSFNFLVDHQLNAKIADLELGISPLNENKAGTIKGDEILANWAAPEVILGDKYTQAADIYSFALVLWEILSGKQPFMHIKKQADIRTQVVSGERPELPDCFTFEMPDYWQQYVALIERSWQPNSGLRPTAVEIHADLTGIYRYLCQRLVFDAKNIPDLSSIIIKNPKSLCSDIDPNVIADLTKDCLTDSSYDLLELDEGAWVIVTKSLPHFIVRANSNWSILMGLDINDILGHALFPLIMGEKTETKNVDALVQSFEEIENHTIKFNHAVLTLYYNNILNKRATTKTDSLFSLHSFPVNNKNYDSTLIANQKERKFSLFKKGAFESDTNTKISFIAIQFNELTPSNRAFVANDESRGSMSIAGKQAMMEVFDNTRQSLSNLSSLFKSSIDNTNDDKLKRNIPLVYITSTEEESISNYNSVSVSNGSIEC